MNEQPNFVADLFWPPPDQWGYRGDPLLWAELQTHLAETTLPETEVELAHLLVQGFRDLTGVDLALLEELRLPKYETGGMSSGMISGSFWRDRGFPTILGRFRRFSVARQDASHNRNIKLVALARED